MEFGHKWIKWCISSSSFSILINGTLSGFFQNSRGLRQADPISPYLLLKAQEGGFISGFMIGGRGG